MPGLADAITRLVSASKLPARSRSQPVDRTVQTICDNAYRSGLSEPGLSELIQAIRKPNHLDQNTITDLVKNLYPAHKVSDSIVYDVVSSIGPGSDRPSIPTQSLLIQWLILVKDLLEDDTTLMRCYAALFNQLHALGTRPVLCHLLAIITKRRHVKPWRIRMLLGLARNATIDTGLLSLLRIYKDFYPTIVLDQPIGRIKAAGFKAPDPEWRHHLFALQTGDQDAEAAAKPSSFRVVRKGTKRSRVEIVPEVYTANAGENATTLEEIDGAIDFADRLDKIEPPSQIVSALDDPLLQKYLSIVESKPLQSRFDTWLSFYLDSQLVSIAEGRFEDRNFEDILAKVLQFARATKTLPVSALSFLNRLVNNWDGESLRDQILELCTFLPMQAFNDIYTGFLSRLEDCVLESSDPGRLLALLRCYTGLYRNWTIQLLQDPTTSSEDGLNLIGARSSLLAMQIVAVDPHLPHSFLVLQHLAAMAHAAHLAPTHPNIRILTPDAHVLYMLAFQHPTNAVIAPLCGILATYKTSFESTMAAINARNSQPTPPSQGAVDHLTPYPRDYVNGFNGFLMDLCNFLWRSRAFNRKDTNARGCLVRPEILPNLQMYLESRNPPQSLALIFSVSHHPAFAAMSLANMQSLESAAVRRSGRPANGDTMELDDGEETAARHAGPVSAKSLAQLETQGGIKMSWQEFRIEVLNWLDRHGMGGVGALMFCTMRQLVTKRLSEVSGA